MQTELERLYEADGIDAASRAFAQILKEIEQQLATANALYPVMRGLIEKYNESPASDRRILSVIYTEIARIVEAAATLQLRQLEFDLNVEIFNETYGSSLSRDYLGGATYVIKKHIVLYINDRMRQIDATIAHPETGEPCILFAVPSRDGAGRYTLESRITKKRTGFYKSLKDIHPVKIAPDVPRKEGVIERRKRQSEDGQAPDKKPRRKQKEQG